MKRTLSVLCAAAIGVAAVSCSDSSAPQPATSGPLSGAFSTVPLGFDMVLSSFAGMGDSGQTGWRPGDGNRFGGFGDGLGDLFSGPRGRGGRGGRGMGGDMDGPDGRGGPGGPGGNGMMCGGGLGGPFGGGFDLGLGHGRFGAALPADCVFDSGSGRVNCPPDTVHGLIVTRSAAYADTAGAVQSAFDSATTNTINGHVDVSGTIIRRDGDTSMVSHTSDRTVTGLAPGSAARTVNGTSAGAESTTGTDSTGAFTSVRVAGDTAVNVVIPAPVAGVPPIPTSGTLTRVMQVTVTYTGGSTITSSRREVVTFDASGVATIVITQDGVSQTCTMTLPHGQLNCQ